MAENEHKWSDELRRIIGTPHPTETERQAAWHRLHAAMETESASSRQRPRYLRPAVAVGLVAIALTVALISVQTPPANAVLLELARAAEKVAPITLTQGQAVYVRSDVSRLAIISGEEIGVDVEWVSYLLPVIEESWDSGDGSIVVRSAVGAPTFFDAAIEVAYYQAGQERIDRVGESFEEAFAGAINKEADQDWPTNPDALRRAMTSWINQGSRTHSDDVALFELAGRVLRYRPTEPTLRAAILEVLATLDLTTIKDPESPSLTVTIKYNDSNAALTQYLIFDDDGYLVSDSTITEDPIPDLGIPPGTTIAEGSYTIPTLIVWTPPEIGTK